VIGVPQTAIELAKRFEGFHRVPRADPGRAHPYVCPQATGRLATAISAIRSTRRSPSPKPRSIWRATCRRRCTRRCATARCWPPSPRAARGHRGLHLQPRRGAAADVDAAAAGQSAGLGCRCAGTAPMGLWRRESAAEHSPLFVEHHGVGGCIPQGRAGLREPPIREQLREQRDERNAEPTP
jgi:hypothetical protein